MTDIDLDRLIDRVAAELPELEPPPELDAEIFALLDSIPQDPPVLDELPEPEAAPQPANRPARWLVLAGPLVAIAAALLVAVLVVPGTTGEGNPDNWIFRGEEGPGPGLDLSMVVQEQDGPTGRFERGRNYEQGDTLLFQVDAYAGGVVTLVRIDADGATFIHSQEFDGAGTADLKENEGSRVGYALEQGETEAVFAVIRTDSPLTEADVAEGLAVGADVEAVCAAAWDLGGRCSAVRVEAVQ